MSLFFKLVRFGAIALSFLLSAACSDGGSESSLTLTSELGDINKSCDDCKSIGILDGKILTVDDTGAVYLRHTDSNLVDFLTTGSSDAEILGAGNGSMLSVLFDGGRGTEANLLFASDGSITSVSEYRSLLPDSCTTPDTVERAYTVGNNSIVLVSVHRDDFLGFKCSLFVTDLNGSIGPRVIRLNESSIVSRNNQSRSVETSFFPQCKSRNGRVLMGTFHVERRVSNTHEYTSFRVNDFAQVRIDLANGNVAAERLAFPFLIFPSEFDYWSCATTRSGSFQTQLSRGVAELHFGEYRESLQKNFINGAEVSKKRFAISYTPYGSIFRKDLDFNGIPSGGNTQRFEFHSWDGGTVLEYPANAKFDHRVFRSGDSICLSWSDGDFRTPTVEYQCANAEF